MLLSLPNHTLLEHFLDHQSDSDALGKYRCITTALLLLHFIVSDKPERILEQQSTLCQLLAEQLTNFHLGVVRHCIDYLVAVQPDAETTLSFAVSVTVVLCQNDVPRMTVLGILAKVLNPSIFDAVPPELAKRGLIEPSTDSREPLSKRGSQVMIDRSFLHSDAILSELLFMRDLTISLGPQSCDLPEESIRRPEDCVDQHGVPIQHMVLLLRYLSYLRQKTSFGRYFVLVGHHIVLLSETALEAPLKASAFKAGLGLVDWLRWNGRGDIDKKPEGGLPSPWHKVFADTEDELLWSKWVQVAALVACQWVPKIVSKHQEQLVEPLCAVVSQRLALIRDGLVFLDSSREQETPVETAERIGHEMVTQLCEIVTMGGTHQLTEIEVEEILQFVGVLTEFMDVDADELRARFSPSS